MGANIGWLFYKDYFKGIDYHNIEDKKNEILIQRKVSNIISQTPKIQEDTVLGNIHFQATTTYPGLLLGSGNAHELPHIEGQAILGFHFDYTTGLPVIQGSSIKGVIRSAFVHQDYIKELLDNDDLDIKSLEDEIFLNNDIFFDAVIVKSDKNNKILGDDYLAPHGDNPLKNPKPLRFIKVLPDVTFMFDFQLNDGLISKDTKRKLFENILEDLGLGAKTNVGYGRFEHFSTYKTKKEQEEDDKLAQQQQEQRKAQQLKEIEDAKKAKEQKAKEGIESLFDCKTLDEAFKLLKESFGKVPKPTPEQKAIIKQYHDKQKNLSKKDEKVFKKYLK